MQLNRQYINIMQVIFSDSKTHRNGHTLFICAEEIIKHLSNKAFSKISLEIANPGERTRLTNVADIVQPMVNLDDPDSSFPGYTGTYRRVFQGNLLCLRGIAVTEICQIPLMQSTILDMYGPGAEQTMFSNLIHVALIADPSENVKRDDYLLALNQASCKLAAYLANSCKGTPIDEEEIFSLDASNSEPSLPHVAYLYQYFSHKHMTEALYYGDPYDHSLATIIHPNEILAGALLNRNYDLVPFSDPTYIIQNHPVILELYRRHQKSLNFAGVVLVNSPSTMEEKNRNADQAAFLAKYGLNADYALLTKEGGGHPQVDLKLECDYCANLGIPSVIIVAENVSTSGLTDEAILFNSVNADAIISAGCLQKISLSKMDRLIGNIPIAEMRNCIDLKESMLLYNKYIRGALSQLGGSNHTSLKY